MTLFRTRPSSPYTASLQVCGLTHNICLRNFVYVLSMSGAEWNPHISDPYFNIGTTIASNSLTFSLTCRLTFSNKVFNENNAFVACSVNAFLA